MMLVIVPGTLKPIVLRIGVQIGSLPLVTTCQARPP